MKLLFVCSGNTCRSPLAEAIARREVIERGWLEVDVESAGTGATDGSPPSDGSFLIGLEHGLDLGGHTARQLTPALVTSADLILTMSASHLAAVQDLGGSNKAALLGAFAGGDPAREEVSDPFGGDLDSYRDTYRQLAVLVRAAFQRLEIARSGRGA